MDIKDESGDKKYFTIIPNYILNHSTLWDREVYIQMKRVTGEKNTCWMSQRTLAKQCGISINRLKKSLKYLVDNKWIVFIGQKEIGTTGGTQKVNEYKIIDLWKMNNDFYQGVSKRTPLEDKGVSRDDIPITKGVSRDDERGIIDEVKGVSPDDDKEEPKKEEHNNTDFLSYWLLYPKKVGKLEALKSWNKIKPSIELQAKMKDTLIKQINSEQWKKDNGRFIPNPATWLNQGRWDDEVIIKTTKTTY